MDGETQIEVLRFESDEEGKFRVPLSPGEYVIASLEDKPYPSCWARAKVADGEFTEVKVVCDSGIR